MRTLALLLTLSAPSFAGDYFVDPVLGDDANSGTVVTDPVATITRALLLAGSGSLADIDEIRLAPGTYGAAETYPLVLGSHQRLIGSGAATTVIDAGAAPVCIEAQPISPFWTFEESALHLRDLTLTGAGIGVQHLGLQSSPILGLKVDRCLFETQQGGLDMVIGNLSQYQAEVRDTRFEGNSVGIDQLVGEIITGSLVVEDCVFTNTGTGISTEDTFLPTWNFVEVRRTRIIGAGVGIDTSQIQNGQHLHVEDSLIEASVAGIKGNIESVTIDHCTITGATTGVASASGCFCGLSVRNSILFGNGVDYAGAVSVLSTDNIIGSGPPSLLALNSQKDPLFRDAAQGDHRLTAGSPAIDQVATAGLDVTGFDRSRADGDLDTVVLSDLGAFEFRVLDGPGTSTPGSTIDLDLRVAASEFAWVVSAPLATQPIVTTFGDRWLEAGATLTTIGVVLAPDSVSVTILNSPALIGTELVFQALVRSPFSPTGAAWSNPITIVVE